MRHYRDELQPTHIKWPEHWTNGGTGVTKFDADRRPLYEAAIEKSGRDDLFLKDNALHCRSNPTNLSDFWQVFRELDAAEGEATK